MARLSNRYNTLGTNIAAIAPTTEWESYTPTTAGFGTITADDVKYQRIGSTILVQGEFTTGTTSADGKIYLPTGLTISGASSTIVVGQMNQDTSANNQLFPMLATNGNAYFQFGNINRIAATNPLAPVNANAIITGPKRVAFYARAEIAEWSNGTTESAIAFTGPTKYQINYLPADLISTSNDNSDLRFNNLEIGKTYKLTMHLLAFMTTSNPTNEVRIVANNNSASILKAYFRQDQTSGDAREINSSSVITFVAAATSIVFDITIASATIRGHATDVGARTFTMLEELPTHEVTTDWD